MSFAHFEFITDNPFRLCGIGSAATLDELRQKAKAMDMAARVGLPLDIGLEAVFGAEDAGRCASIVQALENDPKRLALYRLFWPLTYQHPAAATGELADLDALGSDAPAGQQRHFLQTWYRFQTQPTLEFLTEALATFAALRRDADANAVFANLLEHDTRVVAPLVLPAAQTEAARHLLSFPCGIAAEEWQAGKHQEALGLLAAVLHSDFENEVVDVAIRTAMPIGNREQAHLEKLAEDYSGWTPERGTSDFAAAEPLLQFVKVMQERLGSEATLWADGAQAYFATIGFAMHAYAIDAWNERKDWQTALTTLQMILSLPTVEMCHERAREDRHVLFGNMRGCAVDAVNERDDYPAAKQLLRTILDSPDAGEWHETAHTDFAKVESLESTHLLLKEMRPVKSPPSLHTINGVGTTLYGQAPFAGSRELYYATQYFCILYLPIFALSRYVVSSAPKGGWYFHHKAPLTKANKIHSLISAIILGSCILYLLVIGSSDNMPAASSSYTSSYPSSDTGTMPQATPPSSVMPTSDRQRRLEAEATELYRQEDVDGPKIKAEFESVKAEKTRLDGLKLQIDEERKVLDNASQGEIESFNQQVRKANKDFDAYDARIRRFRVAVDKAEKREARLKEIQQALSEAGN